MTTMGGASAVERIRLRPASERDFPTIRSMVRTARLNPMGLRWQNFYVAERGHRVIGCAQIKEHRDGVKELASLVVREGDRRQGVARALIERLMEEASPPVWLMCRSGLASLYARFGFEEVLSSSDLPRYFRRLRQLVGAFGSLAKGFEGLSIMRWDGDEAR